MAIEHAVIYKTIALQYLAVLLGIAWGWAARIYPRHVPTWWMAPATLSLIMLGVASFKSLAIKSTLPHAKVPRLLATLMIYDAMVMVLDPFFMAADEVSCLIAVAVIVLPLLSLKAFVRRRAWLAIWGVILFQATATASLVYNFPAVRGGVGYFTIWVT